MLFLGTLLNSCSWLRRCCSGSSSTHRIRWGVISFTGWSKDSEMMMVLMSTKVMMMTKMPMLTRMTMKRMTMTTWRHSRPRRRRHKCRLQCPLLQCTHLSWVSRILLIKTAIWEGVAVINVGGFGIMYKKYNLLSMMMILVERSTCSKSHYSRNWLHTHCLEKSPGNQTIFIYFSCLKT